MLPKVSCIIMPLLLFTGLVHAGEEPYWKEYNNNFITKDGRIIDYSQDQSSHSEGQGYGMLLSVAFNDRATFDRLWLWTRTNIGARRDNLFAWHWGKRHGTHWGVIDYNNATDGDVLIAYALLKASERWPESDYKGMALNIIRDIRGMLSIEHNGHTFLLPSYFGFAEKDAVISNPSYLIFPAFRKFSTLDDPSFWNKIYKDGQYLVSSSCFGMMCLPADWVKLTGSDISVYTEKSSLLGDEAVRVFLYISTDSQVHIPKGLEKMLELYQKLGYMPLWIDVEKDSISLKPAPAGYYAIYALAAKKIGNDLLSKRLFKEAKERLSLEKNDYYSFSLYLLSTVEDAL